MTTNLETILSNEQMGLFDIFGEKKEGILEQTKQYTNYGNAPEYIRQYITEIIQKNPNIKKEEMYFVKVLQKLVGR